MEATVIRPVVATKPPRTNGTAGLLDIAILKRIEMEAGIKTLTHKTSDHNPVTLIIGDSQKQSYHFKYKANWRAFRILSEEKIKVPTINLMGNF